MNISRYRSTSTTSPFHKVDTLRKYKNRIEGRSQSPVPMPTQDQAVVMASRPRLFFRPAETTVTTVTRFQLMSRWTSLSDSHRMICIIWAGGDFYNLSAESLCIYATCVIRWYRVASSVSRWGHGYGIFTHNNTLFTPCHARVSAPTASLMHCEQPFTLVCEAIFM